MSKRFFSQNEIDKNYKEVIVLYILYRKLINHKMKYTPHTNQN